MSGFLAGVNSIPNPCFVLDELLFEENMQVLHELEKNCGVHVLCALKGFSMWASFPKMMNYISGGTASSLNEVKLINDEMGVKAHSCFVVYNEDEFQEVQKSSSHVIFNSIQQFEKFKNQLSNNVEYGFRINPEFSNVDVKIYNPCLPGSRFGILLNELPSSLPKEITGLHFHTLCESSAEDFREILSVLELNYGKLFHQVKWVNFGGGHHITKYGYNIKLLSDLLKYVAEKYSLDVYIEPGEAIGLNAGFLTAKVEDIVENQGEKTAILNVSFAAHMPDCLEMPYKPSVFGESEAGLSFTLGGNTCMSGDFVRGFRFNKELKVGQVLVFKDMAHYTFVKTTFFNGVEHPSIGVWTKKNKFELLKKFNYQDFKYRLS